MRDAVRPRRRLAPWWLLATLGCADPAPAPKPGGVADTGSDSGSPWTVPDGVVMDAVTWAVRWDTTGLEPPTRGGAFQVRRPDGARIEVQQAWMVLSTLVVESCERVAQAARAAPPHGIPDHPSGLIAPVALPIHLLQDTDLDRSTFPEEEVCAAWLVSFQADETLRGAGDAVDLTGLSFQMTGELLPAGSETWQPLELASALQVDADLVPNLDVPDGDRIEVTFHPRRMFGDLSLPLADPALGGWESLSGLVGTASAALSVQGEGAETDPPEDTGVPR